MAKQPSNKDRRGKQPRPSGREKHGTAELKIHSVKFNVVMNMILTSSAFIFPLITVPYVSRVLSTFGTGSVAFAQSVVSYFSLAALLGIPVYGVRECARVRDDREKLSQTVQELMTILMISSAIVYGLFLIAVFTIPKLRTDVPLMMIFSSVIWLASCGVEWFYQAIEQYGYITIRNIAMKLLGLILMFVFVHEMSDYRIYGLIVVIASYGSNILNVIRLRKFVTFSRSRKLNLRRHFKPMAAFTVSSVSSGMYTQVDLLLVGFLGTTNMVGLYQLVVKIKNLCTTAVNSVGNVMLPRLSYYESHGEKNKTALLMAKNLNFLALSGLALISVILLCAKPIIFILGGPDFIGGTNALILISPALLFSSTNGILSQYLVAIGRERTYAAINFTGLIAAIIYCCILIPIWGIDGAAIAITLCELTVLIIRVVVLKNFMIAVWNYLEWGKIALSSTIAFGISAVITYFIKSTPQSIQFILPLITYALIYGIILILSKESFVTSAIRRAKRTSR